MEKRVQLQYLLKGLIETGKVYFQPPDGAELDYPCIIYSRDSGNTDFADNNPYHLKTRYKITVIDVDPDSKIPEKVAQLPTCTFVTNFKADNLNHDVYNLYF